MTVVSSVECEGQRCDAVVVGSGLGGMLAAAHLQDQGLDVVLLEKHPWPGGRCGAFELEGHRFTRGCNEFGGGVVRFLAEVGVAVKFAPSSTLLMLGEETIRLPPDFASAIRLLWQGPALLRLVSAVRRNPDGRMGELLQSHVRNQKVAGLVSMLAYATGVPPSKMSARTLSEGFAAEFGYDMGRQMVPVGGAGAITEALIGRFVARGGRLVLGANCEGVRPAGVLKRVCTDQGDWLAPHVVTSQAHRALKAEGLKRGLSASQFLLVLRGDFPTIKERAFVHMPDHAEDWLGALDRGQQPDRFGFHLFRDEVRPNSISITGFCLLPRGENEPSAERIASVMSYIYDGVERVMPGFRDAVLFQRFLGPAAYIREHGVRSELSRVVAADDWEPPDQRDPRAGLIHVGNGMSAPGEHAMAAMLSGRRAAEAVRSQQGGPRPEVLSPPTA